MRLGAPRLGSAYVGGKLEPSLRAKLYRLPPHVREPLLQGMQERGPAGYQELIDVYYKQLSKQVNDKESK